MHMCVCVTAVTAQGGVYFNYLTDSYQRSGPFKGSQEKSKMINKRGRKERLKACINFQTLGTGSLVLL